MREGTASHTARSVAAHRLQYARLEDRHGEPAADEALGRDIAGDLEPRPGRMHEYLRARTRFFDAALLSALEAGMRQVVIGGAGYDGRALRYRRPGVRWFELDHPATQADKRERLTRLNLETGHIRFAAADFATDPIASVLTEAGLDPSQPTLFLLEGVAVYLEQPVLERLLTAFRQVAADGSTLVISVTTATGGATRQRFVERVAAVGEPARSTLAADQAGDLLAATGWRLTPGRERGRSAGLLTATTTSVAAGTATATPTRAAASAPRAARRRTPAPVTPVTAVTPVTPDEPGPLPLSALLSQLLVAFTIEADNEAEHRLPHSTTRHGRSPDAPRGAPWLTSMLMWANCLRFLPPDGITLTELHRRARTNTNLKGMSRWGYVTFTPDPGRGQRPDPDAIIRPTVVGSEARDIWAAVTDEVAGRWRDRFGRAAIDALASALGDVVAALDPALPDCLPILGYGLFSRLPESEPGVPPEPAGHRDRPLWALLSRVLLSLALAYEREPGPSLAISANALRVLTADGVRSRDIPALSGASSESVSMALGVLAERGLAVTEPDPAGSRYRVTRLTADGARAQRAYPERAAAIETGLARRCGQERIAALRSAADRLVLGDAPRLGEGLAPYPDGWRASLPPLAILPHYPLTLHRGGYPDGS